MHTIRLFVVTDPQGKHHVFDGADVEKLKTEFTEEEYDLFIESGEWKEIRLHEPLGRHEEEINRLCIVRDENDVFRLDSNKLPAARAKVLIESWVGFPAPFSVEVYGNLPLILAKVIDAQIVEFMNPAPMGREFFSDVEKAVLILTGEGQGKLTMYDLPLGIMEWVRCKTGEPMLYGGRLLEMPAEEYRRSRLCFEVERKQQEKDLFRVDAISKLHEQLRREFMAE